VVFYTFIIKKHDKKEANDGFFKKSKLTYFNTSIKETTFFSVEAILLYAIFLKKSIAFGNSQRKSRVLQRLLTFSEEYDRIINKEANSIIQ
jgi:hypothetical protein